MILSVSRRTDIPAFYAEWFFNRLEAGFACVRNPMNPRQVSRVPLKTDAIDCIVFWSKNPEPMLSKLDGLRDFRFYFQFTLTGYGEDIEAGLPDKRDRLIPTFRRLSREIGPERVIWRYDPILFNARYTPAWHLRTFAALASTLEGHTKKCVVSFVDMYRWNARALNALGCRAPSPTELTDFAGQLNALARAHGLEVSTCAEAVDLSAAGIAHGACIDKALIERLAGCRLKVRKDPGQRSECLCAQSVDIGAYDTCGHGCVYCYAARTGAAGRRAAQAKYDPRSPILCDAVGPEDRITEKPVKSLLERQIAFDEFL